MPGGEKRAQADKKDTHGVDNVLRNAGAAGAYRMAMLAGCPCSCQGDAYTRGRSEARIHISGIQLSRNQGAATEISQREHLQSPEPNVTIAIQQALHFTQPWDQNDRSLICKPILSEVICGGLKL